MKKFKVTVYETVTRDASFWVEAKDADNAYDVADEKLRDPQFSPRWKNIRRDHQHLDVVR